MINKFIILMLLSYGFLHAGSKYEAKIGCKYGLWHTCIKSVKLDGRLTNQSNLLAKHGPQNNYIQISIWKQSFDLEVRPSGDAQYFVTIEDSKYNEVFHDEKANRFSAIKVGN